MLFAEGICVGIFKSCCDRLIGLLEVLKGLCMSVREHISKARCPNSTKFSARVTRGIHPRGKWRVSLRWNFRGRKIAWNSAYVMQRRVDHDRRASVLFFSRPRSEGWLHHGRTFSIYLCPLSLWLSLPRGVLSTSWCCPSRPCVVFLACVHLASFLAFSFSRQPPCFLMAWQ